MGSETGRAGWQEWKETGHHCYRSQAGGPAASAVGRWRSIRTAAQHEADDISSSLVDRNTAEAQSRVPVTAQMAWPNFYLRWWKPRSPNRWQHRLKREHPTCTERESLIKSADGRVATGLNSAEKNLA